MVQICKVFLPLIVWIACTATGRRVLGPDGLAFDPNLARARTSTSKSARHTSAVASIPKFKEEMTDLEFVQVKRGGYEELPQWKLTKSEEKEEYKELEKLLSSNSMGKLDHEIGEVLEGPVVSFDTEPGQGRGALITIGGKLPAFLPVQEMDLDAVKKSKATDYVEIGENIKVVVIAKASDGQYIVSRLPLLIDQAWDEVLRLMESDSVVEAKVVKNNLAGAIVSVNGIEGFIPKMHLDVELTDELIGTTLPCKILDADRQDGEDTIVLSNKNAIMEETMKNIKLGDIVTGVVQGVTNFGCFVDFGGVSGLLHVSQVSGIRVADVNEVCPEGSTIKAMVIEMHTARDKRVALSTKVLEPTPGDMLTDPEMVFAKAEETAKDYHRLQKEKKEKMEEALEQALGDFDSDSPKKDKASTTDELFDSIFGDS